MKQKTNKIKLKQKDTTQHVVVYNLIPYYSNMRMRIYKQQNKKVWNREMGNDIDDILPISLISYYA